MKTISARDTLALSVAERILLVEEIWDTIVAESSDETDLTDEDKKIIDQRLASYHRNPDGISEWKDVEVYYALRI
jgi:putative addiction module component (TIGR02574 family)